MLKRNLPLIGWIILVIYIIYGTFIPFDFSFRWNDIVNNIKQVNYIPFYFGGKTLHLADTLSNLLLFVPYGFFLYWGLQQKGVRKGKGICILSAFLFSLGIEFLQLFSFSRVSSSSDIINNTVGVWLGCILARIFLLSYKDKFLQQLKIIRQKNPLLIFLILYSLLILLGFMFPFDISIEIRDIYRAFKTANLIPFHDYFYDYSQADLLFINIGFNIFPFIIFGFIGYAALRIYSPKAIFKTIFLGFCLSLLIEICQICIISRMFDVTGIIMRVIGISFGVLISVINYYRK